MSGVLKDKSIDHVSNDWGGEGEEALYVFTFNLFGTDQIQFTYDPKKYFDAGTYSIDKFVSYDISGNNDNYVVSYAKHTVTLTPLDVKVELVDRYKIECESPYYYTGEYQFGELSVSCDDESISFTEHTEGSNVWYQRTYWGDVIKAVVTGGGTEVGTYDLNVDFVFESGNKSNYNFIIPENCKTLNIEKRPVTFTGESAVESAAKKYTGSEIELTSVTSEGLVSGHTANVTYSAKGTDVGKYTGTITEEQEVKITANISGKSVDVTNNYDITTIPGTLQIVRDEELELTVTLEGAVFTYDGQPHPLPKVAVTNAKTGETKIEYSKNEEEWVSNLSSLTAIEVEDSCIINVRATNPNYSNIATSSAILEIINPEISPSVSPGPDPSPSLFMSSPLTLSKISPPESSETPAPEASETPTPSEAMIPELLEPPTPELSGTPTPATSEMLTPIASEPPVPVLTETPTPVPSETPTPELSGIPSPKPSGIPTRVLFGTPIPKTSGTPTPIPTEMPLPTPITFWTPTPILSGMELMTK